MQTTYYLTVIKEKYKHECEYSYKCSAKIYASQFSLNEVQTHTMHIQ